MTSAERVAAITRGDRPDRIPILPFTGGFCAQIVGYPIRTIYPILTGMLTELAGVLAAAWLLTILPLLSLIVVYLFVPEPAAPQVGPPGK